ncbi:glycosyltransferase [Clostridium perfringens]|uniref:glycosyltransferase n=1 Tax=Clostridium perfringens TaxID=1502 RepID=UPI0018E41821|nr:glycosyltransferase [Clostridium perfringens]MBI5997585.1 glycosyltransferase [Clostridium perfringens]
MRILYVINSLHMAGAEKLTLDLAKLGKSKNIVIDIYVLNNSDTNLKLEAKNNNINIFNCGTNSYRSIKHFFWLIKYKDKYDVIHSHLSYSQYYVALIRLLDKNKKLITTEHSTFNERRKYKIFKVIEKWLYSAYDNIVVINNDNKASMIKWQSSISDKIIVISNGIDVKKFINGKKERINEGILIKNKKSQKILMVAAFRKEKNHEIIVNAMNKLDDNKVLILVGTGPEEYINNIKCLIDKNGINSRVFLLGERTDVEDIMKCCDLFVLPSRWEGFGLVVAEAMASGLPVVASNVQGVREVVGDCGLLFENENIQDLIGKINRIFTMSKEERKILTDMARKRSLKYSIENTFEKYLDLYKS